MIRNTLTEQQFYNLWETAMDCIEGLQEACEREGVKKPWYGWLPAYLRVDNLVTYTVSIPDLNIFKYTPQNRNCTPKEIIDCTAEAIKEMNDQKASRIADLEAQLARLKGGQHNG